MRMQGGTGSTKLERPFDICMVNAARFLIRCRVLKQKSCTSSRLRRMMRAVPNSPVEEDRLAVLDDRLDGARASIEPIGYVQDEL